MSAKSDDEEEDNTNVDEDDTTAIVEDDETVLTEDETALVEDDVKTNEDEGVKDDLDVVEKEVEKEDENDNFIYNDMLARALVQLFPREERTLIHMWLEKLRSASVDDSEKLSNRNNYMWLLLSILQNGSLVEPFDEAPPVEELPPICEIMPAQMIEEMISSPDRNFSHLLDASGSDANVMDLKEPRNTGMPPHKFLDHQPRPVNGISCYYSVFSKSTD